MTHDDNDLLGEPDARVWARRFVERTAHNPLIAQDEGTMLSWFANAMGTAVDVRNREAREFRNDGVYRVERCTTDKLADVLNSAESEDVDYEFVGGRDWVIVFRRQTVLEITRGR